VANLSAYKFVTLSDLEERRDSLRGICGRLNLKGTVLLSTEGINVFLAGGRSEIDEFLDSMKSRPEFRDLLVKLSYNDYQPFSRMLVKIKNEIISFGVDGIDPRDRTSPKLPATTLKQWLDEGRPVNLLDIRNEYEIGVGTFKNATSIGVDNFRDFPEAVAGLPEEFRENPTVMFCTGGIRCEKAGPMLEQAGFKNVFQLDGGILRYFEECGGAHYDGDCFVFDKRVALDPDLNETPYEQCYNCQSVLTPEDQASPYYHPPRVCPNCFQTPEQLLIKTLAERHEKLKSLAECLPGCTPYENRRPINVPKRFAATTLLSFLCDRHPHIDEQQWRESIESGRIVYRDLSYKPIDNTTTAPNRPPITADLIVTEGQRFDHVFPDTVEPQVNAAIEIIHEDDSLVVVNKPAPLPMHPCGRFNLNTLQNLLNIVYEPQRMRLAHRLDANTSGVVVLCRTRSVARRVIPQFEAGAISKTYIARVYGHPEQDEFECRAPISSAPDDGGLRLITADGLNAITRFTVEQRLADGTALLSVRPQTGRTNQIRVHLWHSGHPIVGDPFYLPDSQTGTNKALEFGEPPLCLHALSIELTHPDSKRSMTFTATPPDWANPDE
jgi:RluA family pseudouridine synthase